MKDYYDFSKGFRDPSRAERLRKNGCRIRVTEGEGENEKVVEEFFVSPEEIQAQTRLRECRRAQG